MTTTAPERPVSTQPGQLRNLLVATLASTVGFWAWTMVGPLSKLYTDQLSLSSGQAAFLVAMPIFVGSLGRIPAGILTDRYGGRVMFTVVLGLAAPFVALTGIAGATGSFAFLMVSAFLLGIAGAVFSVGIPFSSAWYDARRKGFATGVFGAGMVGTAVSAFCTPRIVAAIGYLPAHLTIAVLTAATALLCWLVLRDSPTWHPNHEPALPKLATAFRMLTTWQLCFLYAVAFGAFVAFSNYLPTYLSTVYGFDGQQAGTRAAGFAVAAVVARPIGGALADRFGPFVVSAAALAGVVVFAEVVAFQPIREVAYGTAFLCMAFLLGLGAGGVFAWVGRVVPANTMGTVGGIIAAAGGLGGYFPPLVMGYTYDPEHHSYFVGLTLLAVFAVLALGVAVWLARGARRRSTD